MSNYSKEIYQNQWILTDDAFHRHRTQPFRPHSFLMDPRHIRVDAYTHP